MATKKPFPGAFHGSNNRFPTSNDQDGQYSVNLLQEDSDSDETEEPRYPWDVDRKPSNSPKAVSQKRQWMRTQRSPSKKERITQAMKESPTTRALNTFSQNTSDLMQYRPSTESYHKLHSSMLSNDGKQSPQQRDLPKGYHLHWGVHPIRIIPPTDIGDDSSTQSRVHTQPLGAVIAREAFPMMTHYTRRNHCIIKRLHPDGLAMRCGLQQGDWFLLPMDKALFANNTSRDSVIRAYETSNDPPQLATFDEIQEWSKDSYPNYRPIRVLRKKVNTWKNKEGVSRTTATDLLPTSLQVSTESKSHENPTPTESLPPYCILCNYYKPSHWSNETPFGQLRTKPKRAPRNHHAWCPKHKDFDAVRVQKRLARTKHCFQVLGCEACHFEYQTGKVVSIKKKPTAEDPVLIHNEACLLYQDMLKNEDRLKHKQEQEKLEAEARKKAAEAKKRKQQHKSTSTGKRSEATRQAKKFRHKRSDLESSSSDSENSDNDHGFEDGSIYQPPTRKARMETFALSKKRKGPESVFKKKDNSKTKQNLKVASQDSRSKEDTDKGKPVWIPLDDNPWGKECYQTGDILLYGPQLGSGHHETQNLSNERYKVSPFAENSTYNSTHTTPPEGLALIMLKRDAMGRMPWGFQTVRDEFGSACLVESVDPCSPASSATFLGVHNSCTDSSSSSPPSSALAVNDMIVLINGKQVGGMTEVGLELELEIAGPNLLLGVSRYKHAKKVANRFAEMERKMLDFMDRAARDERLMGWREIGCGDAVEQRETTVALSDVNKVTPTKPQLEETNNLSTLDSSERMNDQVVLPQREVESMKTKSQAYAHGDNISAMENNDENDAKQRSSSQNSEDSAAHDDNPQMGCVCGTKHIPSLIKTFWIQCESCDSWYHVAEKCIGFGEQQATRDEFQWSCAVCAPDTDTDEVKSIPNEDNGSIKIPQSDEARKECDQPTKQTGDKISSSESMGIQTNNGDEGAQEPVPNKQRKKKPSTPPALRALKSYNIDGSSDGDRLGYWEDFETMSARGNPDRCLRKRQSKTKDLQEPRTDEDDRKGGENNQLPIDRKTKDQSTKKTNRSIQNQQEKNTERDGTSETSMVPSSGEDDGTRSLLQTFKVGDLVFVESHAWAYVNNYGGIGFIQKTYLGADGDRVYDVKYPALDRTEKGIMVEYISPYSFD